MELFDSLVIGQGPCGIQASINMARFGLKVLCLGTNSSALIKAPVIENYYGIESINGKELSLIGLKQAQNFGVLLNNAEVTEISFEKDFFHVKTNKLVFESKTILIATGKSRSNVKILSKFDGIGVSYCASCDGFFYRKKKVGLIGSSNYMLEEYEILRNLGIEITVFTNGESLDVKLDDETHVITDKIIGCYGDEKHLRGLKTITGDFDLDGVFIAIGQASGFSFAKHLGIMTNQNDIVVNDKMETNIKGIYAGGDVIGEPYQISKAVGDGIKAAQSIFKYLKSEK